MDRLRAGSPVFSRQRSSDSSSTGSSSPAHPRSSMLAAGGVSGIRRSQNVAAKAAAARLAQVMATQVTDLDDYEDEESDSVSSSNGSAVVGPFKLRGQITGINGSGQTGNGGSGVSAGTGTRINRSPSPALGRNFVEHNPLNRAASTGRPSSLSTRAPRMVPPSVTSLRTPSPIPPIQPQSEISRNKGFLADIDRLKSNKAKNDPEDSELQDKLDLLQEENDKVLDQLRLMEARCEEAEARAHELEKQVASLGEGVSLEARLLSRKEAALRQREAALKAAAQTKDGRVEELAALRQEVDSAKDMISAANEQCKEAESQVAALRSMTQRMILTQEEMEEVVLKRCWLARYWGLALHHGVYPDIAISKHEYWSSLAPLPFEVVVSAGQKAKEDSSPTDKKITGDEPESRNKPDRDLSDIAGEGNIENMLYVEKGLRELASLKVEDAVVFSMAAQHHRPNFIRLSNSDFKSPGESKFLEALELSQEESEDVFFKLAWLTYFWRRAKTHGVEDDIADERLQFWIGRSRQSVLTTHDAVDVERGLVELKKLGIEQQLWEASRKQID